MSDVENNRAPAWAGQPYSIKRHGVTITDCDAEPVQTPGCIQAHGALLVLRPTDLVIMQASENVERWFGRSAQDLLGQSLSAVIGESGHAAVAERLRRGASDGNPTYVFTCAPRDGLPFDVTVHTVDGVVVVELEPCTGHDRRTDRDLYALVLAATRNLQSATSLRDFNQIMTREVQALTGMDRVMVYRFHEDGHGEVVAETKRDELAPWLGLHYPAQDIPEPAREIFRQTWIRPVPDVAGDLAELVPLTNIDTGRPLSMTHCALRGPSVMYTEYLQNMRVRASLTMAIRRGDALWGLIACHHYSAPHFLAPPLRTACEFFAQVASLQHQAAEHREHWSYQLSLERIHQQLVAEAARANELTAVITSQPSLLDAVQATGAALYTQGRWWRVGQTPGEAELEALGAWLKTRAKWSDASHPAYVTSSLARDYPPSEAFADLASGVLAVPLSTTRASFVVWFRPESIQTVRWGGNPHDKPTVPGPHGPRLTPRRSFELFVESVRLRSLPWTQMEIDAACRLRVLLMELVVSRDERLARLNQELQRSNDELDMFTHVASHDLKEPLRGIHRYAHQLLEDASQASEEQRTKLAGLMRLTSRMDSLLDSLLRFSRVGQATLGFEQADLSEVLAEARDMVSARLSDRPTKIVVPRPLPPVRCDRACVREVFVNLLSNALKYNDKPQSIVEVGYILPDEPGRTGAPAEAARHSIFYVKDNGIGIHAHHHEQVFTLFKRLHGRAEYGGGSGAGLTIVRKIIDRHAGRIWLESRPGQGTTFYFTLPTESSESP